MSCFVCEMFLLQKKVVAGRIGVGLLLEEALLMVFDRMSGLPISGASIFFWKSIALATSL